MSEVRLGLYRHYKGGIYEVMGVGRHTENLEELVVYRSVHDNSDFAKGTVWVRPLAMFFDLIDLHGKMVRRFELVDDENAE